MDKTWKGSTGDGEHVTGLLSEYIDGSLGKDERAFVLRHIQDCPDCKADYIELSATRRLLAQMPVVAPPRAFTLTPEMVAPTRRPGFLERLFVPGNTPRFAFGSLMSLVLMMLVLLGSLSGRGNNVQTTSTQNAPAPPAFSAQGGAAAPTEGALSRTMQSVADSTTTALPEAQTNSAASGEAGATEGDSAAGKAAGLPTQATGKLGVDATPVPADARAAPPITGAAAPDAMPGAASGSSLAAGSPTPVYAPLNSGGIGSPTTTSLEPAPPVDTYAAPTTRGSPVAGVTFGVLLALLSVLLAAAAFISARRSS